MNTHPISHRRLRGWGVLVASVVLALVPATASAADPAAGSSTYTFEATPSTGGGAAVASFTGVCTLLALDPFKYNSTNLGVRSYQDCVTGSGVITSQLMDLYLDRCTFEFPPGSHNCIQWSGTYILSCARQDGSNYWCPRTNYQEIFNLPAGQYKTRVHGYVYCTCGNGDGWDESNSTFLP